MSSKCSNRLPWFVCLTSGTSKVGTFCNLVNIFPPILTHECLHFVNRQIVQCTYSGEEWEFFFFFFRFSLFIYNKYSMSGILLSEVLWDDAIGLGQPENGVIWLTHPANGPADSIGFKLAIESACHLVSLGHVHLDGRVGLGANDTVAGGAFPRHIQVHELTGVILYVERVSQAPHHPLCQDAGHTAHLMVQRWAQAQEEWEFLKSVAGLSCYLVQIW